MQFFLTINKWLLLLVAANAIGCQRASYQFQPVSGAAYQATAPALVLPESAVVTVASPIVLPGASYQQVPRHPRRR